MDIMSQDLRGMLHENMRASLKKCWGQGNLSILRPATPGPCLRLGEGTPRQRMRKGAEEGEVAWRRSDVTSKAYVFLKLGKARVAPCQTTTEHKSPTSTNRSSPGLSATHEKRAVDSSVLDQPAYIARSGFSLKYIHSAPAQNRLFARDGGSAQ